MGAVQLVPKGTIKRLNSLQRGKTDGANQLSSLSIVANEHFKRWNSLQVKPDKNSSNSKPFDSSDKNNSLRVEQQEPLQELKLLKANSFASDDHLEEPASQRDKSSSKTSRVESEEAGFFIPAKALERPEVQEYLKLYQREQQSAR